MKIKVNDNVLVLAGKYKGKQGKVLATFPKTGKVVVEGVAIVHKPEKARKANETSRIDGEEGPIHVSNVEVVCDKCGKATRIGHIVAENGKKARVCKKCGAVLDKAFVKKSKAKQVEETAAPKKRERKRSKKAEEATTPAEETKE
ncbi:MAG: 50S ribosomal protein L24 [Clostridia bacterium]|nr:50S ribosomal protein L24 [Clostridia bacterium]